MQSANITLPPLPCVKILGLINETRSGAGRSRYGSQDFSFSLVDSIPFGTESGGIFDSKTIEAPRREYPTNNVKVVK